MIASSSVLKLRFAAMRPNGSSLKTLAYNFIRKDGRLPKCPFTDTLAAVL
jgi:hypothetical protein